MNQNPLEATLNQLTGTSQLKDVTIEQLEELANQYPYFPVAQFLLAKKMKTEEHKSWINKAQMASLYFSNPFWFNYQMSETHAEELEININEQGLDLQPGEYEDHPVTTTFSQEEIVKADNRAHEELGNDEQESLDNLHPITTAFTKEEIEAASERAHEELGNEIAATSDEIMPNPIEEKELEDIVISASPPEANSHEETIEGIDEIITSPEDTPTETGETASLTEPEEEHQPDEHEQMFRNIKAMLEKPVEGDQSGIPIDPYHTIDYFASQGIKLELEADPQDKLGIQLKKFTQWLKHMKKLGPEDALENFTDKEPDLEVQQKAEISNITRDVVTEAMAQVLEKQGKNEQAIQLYIKLSFLNPDKSIYFADKIKNLKGI